jgi:hypothetical protein
VRYELGFYIAEEEILHSHRRDNLNSYTVLFIILHTLSPLSKRADKNFPVAWFEFLGYVEDLFMLSVMESAELTAA